ncbi:MAG: alpha/beta fold hydrolase [Lysobacteraceae bacterium]|nr:MAG: alpha/beta fold hydrolase [Xanthomonadaceae bacterium]
MIGPMPESSKPPVMARGRSASGWWPSPPRAPPVVIDRASIITRRAPRLASARASFTYPCPSLVDMTAAFLPVVLLHGCGGSAPSTFGDTGWIAQLAREGRTVVPVTLPGHAVGASRDPASYADLAGATLDLLPRRFDAVGFSLGGKLLLEIAVRAPERVGRLVIGGVGDNVFAPERSGEAAAEALEHGLPVDAPPAVAGFHRYCVESGANRPAVAAVLRRPSNPVLPSERLAAISTSILIVIGDADPVAMPADALVATLTHAQVRILPGVDHFHLPADPDFLRHALHFLAG